MIENFEMSSNKLCFAELHVMVLPEDDSLNLLCFHYKSLYV